MRLRLSDLWSWQGTIDRGPYAVWGVLLFAFKHNLDRVVASWVFKEPWGIFNYLLPGAASSLLDLPRSERLFFAVMVAMALPFIWSGVALTLRRLRDAGLPLPMVALFFVPVLNLFFFVILSFAPPRPAIETSAAVRGQSWLDRVIPKSTLGSAAVSVLLTLPITVFLTVVGAEFFRNYGWGLFIGLPFGMGLISVLIHGYQRPRSFPSCILVALTSVTLAGVALLALALEGVVCLIMAAPLAIPLALMGGMIGYVIQRRRLEPSPVMAAILLALPGLMGLEHAAAPQPRMLQVTSSVVVNASPEQVWRNVVSFSELPPPDEWVFQTGLAYPMRAEIQGTGVGAERHCVFSTGAFVEPITVWDEPRRLAFGVRDEPPPMVELSPYQLHPAHLDHYFSAKAGEFRLTPLPGGRTLLEGTTWYENRFWPESYWRQWSDLIVRRIHMRVLRHVKRLAEESAG
ncbi:MAG TPA: SRPBCC family protein [Terriglobales bacterium]|nr:SRPBCC family protein [Terriglobales bacterium]